MAQRKRATTEPSVDIDSVLAGLKQRLERDGAVKRSEIKPKALQEKLILRLVEHGFEVGKTCVRRPLQAQLADALSHAALIPVTGLASHVAGASSTELKAAIAQAVGAGKVRRALRGTAEVLCGPEVRVLDGEQLRRVGERAQAFAKLVEKVTRKGGLVLLADDVDEALADVQRVVPKRVENKREDETFAALLSAVDSTRDGRSGLSFVPAIVGRLAPRIPTDQVIQMLVSAAARELLELRPEGGIGRLSEAELSVCPPGPHGTKLSWARRLGGGAT